MQHAQEQHDLAQAKAAADIALVAKRTEHIGKPQPKQGGK